MTHLARAFAALTVLGLTAVQARAAQPVPDPTPSAVATGAPDLPVPSESPALRTIGRVKASSVLPICSTATVSPVETINSHDAVPGRSFGLKVTAVDDELHEFPDVVVGENGFGVVSVVRHGRAGGEPGLLVLEARYVVAADGTHVPIALNRNVNGLFLGRTRNSPLALDLIPYVGYATEAYDAIHKGGEVAAGPADSLVVLLGDGAIDGTCLAPPAPAHT